MGKVAKAAGKIVTAPIRIAGETAGRPAIILGKIIGGDIGKIVAQSGYLAVNAAKYLSKGMQLSTNAAFNLHNFKQAKEDFKQGVKMVFGVAVAAVAGVVATFTAQYWVYPLIAVYMDALTNKGGLTYANLNALGNLERSVLGSDHIKRNLDTIYATIVTISSLATYYYASIGIGKLLAPVINAYVPTWISATANVASSGYSIYSTIQRIVETNRHYKKLYDEYLQNLKIWDSYVKQAKDNFFDIITSTQMYRYFAGGDIYNSTSPGAYAFAPLSVNEPYSYIMSYPKPDRSEYEEINSYVTGRVYDKYPGGDMFLQNINADMKWE